MRRASATALAIALLASRCPAQVTAFHCGQWDAVPGQAPRWFAAVQWATPWRHAEASAFAASLGAHLASLHSAASLDHATLLSASPAFWQCAGPWIGGQRDASAPWAWQDGSSVDATAWAPGRPGQASVLPACMLLAGEGGPTGRVTDALDSDFGQPTTSSAILEWIAPTDCNLNLIPDVLEIAAQPDLDGDRDGRLDACESRSPDIDGNGVVDFGDVALVMLDFGPCAACPTDLDDNGVVDFGDVALVLLSYGS